MEYRIFFKDKKNEFKGPYTERQVQEWYREGWFDSSFLFFFTRRNESPSDKDATGITLDSLRSFNGIGCPFYKSDEPEKKKDKEEKLRKIEKEITELHEKCEAVLCLEKTIERAEREIQVAKLRPPGDSKTDQKTEFAKPDSIPAGIWHKYYELGCSVSDLILDAFAVYGSGDFASWDKDRVKNMYRTLLNLKNKEAIKGRNAVCEYILIEKMKKKDFFFCSLCEMPLFNYKHALIHFYEHKPQETAAVRDSCIDGFRRVLDSFTKLPKTLLETDEKNEVERCRRNGGHVSPNNLLWYITERCPNAQFANPWSDEYVHLVRIGNPHTRQTFRTTGSVEERVKGEEGRKAMAELHNHLALGKTFCVSCRFQTGDREEYYAHHTSYYHLKNSLKIDGIMEMIYEESTLCLFTSLINVHKKEFI